MLLTVTSFFKYYPPYTFLSFHHFFRFSFFDFIAGSFTFYESGNTVVRKALAYFTLVLLKLYTHSFNNYLQVSNSQSFSPTSGHLSDPKSKYASIFLPWCLYCNPKQLTISF